MPNRQQSTPRSQPSAPAPEENWVAEDLALAVIEANQRWWALQIEAMEAALAENTRHAETMLQDAAKTADSLARWPQLYQGKAQRYTDLTRIGMEIAEQTFTQLNQLMGQLFASSLAGIAGRGTEAAASGEAAEAFVERRVTAQIISFEDRRKPSHATRASGRSAALGHGQGSKRRQAA